MFSSSYHLFKKKIQWATMVELLVVLAIMGMGVAGLLETIGSGIYFAKDTENNIKAINLAREWIEGVINIRDTNWLRFSGDRQNCWRTLDYNGGCINNPSFAWLINSGSYTLITRNGTWNLSGAIETLHQWGNWNTYKDRYKVWLDDRGFYTQTGINMSQACVGWTQTGCLTLFTREIRLVVVWTGTMNVQSIVRWYERRERSVILDTVLTNWKSNF